MTVNSFIYRNPPVDCILQLNAGETPGKGSPSKNFRASDQDLLESLYQCSTPRRADSDLSFVLWDNPDPKPRNFIRDHAKDGIIDEVVRTPILKARKEYYLVIVERHKTYDLSIMQE